MSSPLSSFELARIHNQFVNRIQPDLRLAPEEQATARAITPLHWALWGTAVFGGDESTAYLTTDTFEDASERAIPLFARETIIQGASVLDFQDGDLARRIDAMHNSGSISVQRRLENFSQTMALFARTVGAAMGPAVWNKYMPRMPQTIIRPNQAKPEVFIPRSHSAFQFPIEGSAESVMTFGPGLTGDLFVTAMAGITKEVTLVSGGKGANFIRSWIDFGMQSAAAGIENMRRSGTLAAAIAPSGFTPDNFRLPEVHYRSDGIAQAIGVMSTRKTIDVVVMSAVHTAGSQECLAGVAGASNHLRPGGLLVVKAPDVSLGHEAGMDIVATEAKKLFGAAVASGEAGTLQQHFDPALPLERAASFAIYQR